MVDDLYPTGDRADIQKIKANFQALSRGYGDRVGRTRMNYDLSLRRPYIPRGMCLITGEDLPDIGQSGVARNLILKIREGDINIKLLTKLQNNRGKLSIFTRGYVEWLIARAQKLPAYLESKFIHYRSEATASGQHRRMPEIAAYLSTGFDIVLEYMQSIGVISDIDEASRMAFKTFQEICQKQQEEMQSNTPVEKFIVAIQEMLLARTIYMKPISQASEQWGGELVGFYDEEFYYLLPGPIYSKIRKFYEDQGTPFPLTKNGLYDALREKGIIHTEVNGGATKLKKISGKPQRLLWIQRKILERVESEDPEQISLPWESVVGNSFLHESNIQ